MDLKNYEIVVADARGNISGVDKAVRGRSAEIPEARTQICFFEDEEDLNSDSRKIITGRVLAVYHPAADRGNLVPRVYVRRV